MRPIEKIVLLVGLATALVAGVIFLPDIFGKPTNCGGNSAAMGICKTIMAEIRYASADLGERFDVHQLSQESKANIGRIASSYWIEGAKILIRTNITTDSDSNRIMLICDTAYGNVPQPTIWNGYRHNPAHATAYADGTVKLISPGDFKKLNLAGFIDASLLATNEITRAEIGSRK